MNIITRASVKERIHVEQIIRSQPHMHNSSLVDIVTIPVRKCLGLSMDVYKPVGEVKEPLPIILDVHGGGLIAGRKEQNRNLGIQLARRGYIVFIPDYRLVPETDIFGQISDILDALAVIEAKAAEFGGNIEKLFVTADSAGAFLASMAVASLHHPAEMQPVIGEIVFQEIPSSDQQPKYQLIKGEQEAITLREFYENRLLYKKACYNDIRADDIFWFRHTMLRMIVYNAKHEPSTEHEDIAIICGILFGRY